MTTFSRMKKLAGLSESEDDVNFDVDLSAPKEPFYVFVPTKGGKAPSWTGVPHWTEFANLNVEFDSFDELLYWVDNIAATLFKQDFEYRLRRHSDVLSDEFQQYARTYAKFPTEANSISISNYNKFIDGYQVHVEMVNESGWPMTTTDGPIDDFNGGYPFESTPTFDFVISYKDNPDMSFINYLFDETGNSFKFFTPKEKLK